MDIDAGLHGAPSSSERVILYVETRVPGCNLTVLSRALLVSCLGQANAAEGLLALSSMDLAHWATQCSAEAEPEWEHVGTLEVDLRRNWLLYETHLAEVHLDLFCERGATRPPLSFGRVNVNEVQVIMLPPWFHPFSVPASTDTGLLEAMPDGLSRPYFPCEEPPCQRHFVDETPRTAFEWCVQNWMAACGILGGLWWILYPPIILLSAYLKVGQYPSNEDWQNMICLQLLGFNLLGLVKRNRNWIWDLRRMTGGM